MAKTDHQYVNQKCNVDIQNVPFVRVYEVSYTRLRPFHRPLQPKLQIIIYIGYNLCGTHSSSFFSIHSTSFSLKNFLTLFYFFFNLLVALQITMLFMRADYLNEGFRSQGFCRLNLLLFSMKYLKLQRNSLTISS